MVKNLLPTFLTSICRPLITAVIFILCCSSVLPAQNLFDYSHSRAYARYLLRAGKYDLAADEFQRLTFLAPENDTFKISLLKSYRMGGKISPGIKQWQIWKSEKETTPLVNFEYAKLLLFSGNEPEAIVLAATPQALQPSDVRLVECAGHLLLQNWDQAIPIAPELPEKPILALIAKGKSAHFKSPGLAAAMSAVIPGTGKFYTKDWTDGIVSLMFVGLNTWQAWRRFDREGTGTTWGYIHAGFATGFYIGNIYGSHKAARMYNNRQKQLLRHEAEHLVYPYLD